MEKLAIPMKTLITLSLLVACLLVVVVFVLPRTPAPEPATQHTSAPVWHTSATQSTFAGVQVKEIDPTHADLICSYDLDNNTDTDYQVTKGSTTVVMTRL